MHKKVRASHVFVAAVVLGAVACEQSGVNPDGSVTYVDPVYMVRKDLRYGLPYVSTSNLNALCQRLAGFAPGYALISASFGATAYLQEMIEVDERGELKHLRNDYPYELKSIRSITCSPPESTSTQAEGSPPEVESER